MQERKYGSVGVVWDGCTQPTVTEMRTAIRNGVTFVIEKKEKKQKQKRRWGRASRRLAKKAAREARKRQKVVLVAVATYKVHTLPVKGNHGYGHDERVLAKGQQLGCDSIGLQETRCGRVSRFLFRSGKNSCQARAARSRSSCQGIVVQYVCVHTPVY